MNARTFTTFPIEFDPGCLEQHEPGYLLGAAKAFGLMMHVEAIRVYFDE